MAHAPHQRRHEPPAWRLDFPPELPITARRVEIVRAIREHPVVILSGETGSGKTTQLPKFCLEAGRGTRGRIACTQPRRVAALSVSRRVAEELGVPWGREVGCKIRFNDQTSGNTVVKFLSDGMLLAEAQADRDLRGYDTIIVDEAHERSLNIDFLLGHLNRLRHRRPDLRIVVTSATIDTQKFSAAFGGAPIIEVSGRTYPVETIYAPLDELREESGEFTVVDAAVASVERIVAQSRGGDILIFMPGEREIRDTAEELDHRELGRVQILPLFSRLSAAEQQRVFAPSPSRKIVVATNVAETSLTIPGIKFVVDSGLARLSRYVARTRTKRLPIEPISQSSANQRAGRAGRVSEGVCIRLYAEDDFARRPLFTQPELQRANLAEVILRLLAARLGEIETFPFIDPPAPAAITAGYALLDELGALEPVEPERPRRLSPLGRELAKLPVDPTVGRMLLRARDERALREVLVIAAALSIQDPRERPTDEEAAADAAHRKFVHPESDFLTLLHIWDAYHDEAQKLSLGRLKKFCRAHYLNFNRMREWFDVHAQLAASVDELDTDEWQVPHDEADSAEDAAEQAGERSSVMGHGKQSAPSPITNHPSPVRRGHAARTDDWRYGGERYRAVHRALLSGLLANVARRDEGNNFNATSSRKVFVFPGSTLFIRSEKRAQKQPDAAAAKGGAKPVKDLWILSAEMVETTRLYARTNARLDALWLLDLGQHILKRSYGEPDWHADAGRVLVRERTLLHGLEVQNRHIDYGRIDPERATEIFIRGALVADTLETPTLPFLEHNRRLRDKVATIQTQVRSRHWLSLEEAAYDFYARHLARAGVSSVQDLQREWKKHAAAEPRWLRMEEQDLLGALEEFDPKWFPDQVQLANSALPLDYTYKPGAEEDGITLRLPYRQAKLLQPALLDWLVPGHLEEKVTALLRALPKAARVQLQPLETTAKVVASELKADGRPLAEVLADHLARDYRVAVSAADFHVEELPDHLRVRVEVVDNNGKPLAAGRELAAVKTALAEHEKTLVQQPDDTIAVAWRRARTQHERAELTDWTFGELPPRIVIAESAGVPVCAFPGLVATGRAQATLRLFTVEAEARAATPAGVAALVEAQLSKELAWLERDLRDLRELGPAAVALMPMEQWQTEAFACIRTWICAQPVSPLTREAFVVRVAAARETLKGIVWKLIDPLREALALRTALLTHPQPYGGMEADIAALIGPGFLVRTPWAQLPHLPRYLKAMKARADRWRQDPGKDHRRALQVAPWAKTVLELSKGFPRNAEHARRLDEFRWLVEEYRVSVFAQELGTAQPVSEKKLEQKLGEIRTAAAIVGGVPPPAPAPVLAKPAAPAPAGTPAAAKPTKLSSFGDLGRLLGR
ncbi:MAG TPA: ATP-dependent RNA helicase HrpA [Opitutaceae bacterium]|nr:ATP-dependent RNA helicase HrpA [Opitutaceae bacterium]